MNLRKFALLIHVDGNDLSVVGKTCRFCVRCELIITHQDEMEAVLAGWFSMRNPKVVGKPYLVIGTVEMRAWRDGLRRELSLGELNGRIFRIKKYISLSPE